MRAVTSRKSVTSELLQHQPTLGPALQSSCCAVTPLLLSDSCAHAHYSTLVPGAGRCPNNQPELPFPGKNSSPKPYVSHNLQRNTRSF